MSRERLVDEMAVALCELPRLDDESNCILFLMEQGFRAAVIVKHFDQALRLAKEVRAKFKGIPTLIRIEPETGHA